MSVILLSFSDNKETNSAKGAEETCISKIKL